MLVTVRAMSGWIVIALVALVVVSAAAGAVWARSSRAPATEPEVAVPPRVEHPAPMTGLATALAEAHDRTGRSLGELLAAETDHVEPLRTADDTSPLLRRALDHVTASRDADPPGLSV